MALAIKPLQCNGSCRSCYERRIVAAGGDQRSYDVDAALKRIDTAGDKYHPSIHGGEPLLLGKGAMERILRYCHDKWKQSGIQTNGLLIDGDWIEMFKRYNTSIGVSIDGDTAALNMGRWNKTEASRLQAATGTERVMESIRKLVAAGLRVSVIVVLRQYNTESGMLLELERFLCETLGDLGIYDVRTNPGIVFDEADRAEEELSPFALGHVFVTLADLCFDDPRRMWQPYRDVVDLLLGYHDATCIFTGCDPHFTQSEVPILADGSLGNCLKPSFAIDGIAGLRAAKYSSARQEALAMTPQADGGCADCSYWRVCHGGCPGEAIGNDWRNRTRFCEAYRRLYEHVEQRMLGLIPNLNMQSSYKGTIGHAGVVANISGECGSSWRKDRRKTIIEKSDAGSIANANHGDSHGDEHGDRPHGDHTDQALETK